MTIEKAELKQLVFQDLGGKVGERVVGLKAELLKAEGAARAAEDVAVNYPGFIGTRLKKDVEDGTLTDEQAAVVSRYVRETAQWITTIASGLKQRVPVLQGRVQEAARVAELLDHESAAEKAKAEALAQPDEHVAARGKRRTAGTRPARLKSTRTAKKGSKRSARHT